MTRGKGRNGLLPNSLKIISSCLKTVSSNAGSVANTVRTAGASVAASIAVTTTEDQRDEVLWAGFDKLEIGSSHFKHVLLLGYANGFQVLDVQDASNVHELVSKRDGPVTFLQVQPTPIKLENNEGFKSSHPLLLVVAGDETNGSGTVQGGRLSALIKETANEYQGNCISVPTVVRFYSLKSHSYVHVLRFRSAVYVVRCSPSIVAVALAAQIYCFDAVTLENKFSVLTYPLQGPVGVNTGYGPMGVGPRWLAYASNNPLMPNTDRLSPQNLTPSPGVSPSTSPGNGSLVARYAMESSKHLAAGIINLGDMGYKTLSKYCQELLPDGSSSPLSSYSGRRSGKLSPTVHPTESDNAGMVVIKDFISKDIISQFRAHTSPISALCFDPSGTLLVTASVHGHNINVFRIIPTHVQNGSSPARYDSASSHVHLYKLYRGLTAAVIQDISFSHYSQWIAVVSSRGTCHIYVLSPYGGDASLQLQNSHSNGPVLAPNLTMPWWSASCCLVHQQIQPPPPPTTYSVVSRIKNSNSGWLNTVSNVAASAAGKISVPSGAIAAVFHNLIHRDTLPVPFKANALEHLLVYSPSGHVIQHQLLPSPSDDFSDNISKLVTGPLLQFQDEELHVNSEPVQWWDVCRRSNWPDREEEFLKILCNNEQNVTVIDASDYEDNESLSSMCSTKSAAKETGKAHDRPHWYLSNAEVQINSGRINTWQKSKVCFCVITSPRGNEMSPDNNSGGEIEVEKLPFVEVEIRRKDLLPVFETFLLKPNSNDRTLQGLSRNLPSNSVKEEDNLTKGIVASNIKPASDTFGPRTSENLDGKHIEELQDLMEKPVMSLYDQSVYNSTSMVNCTIVNQLVNSESKTNVAKAAPRKFSEKDSPSYYLKHNDSYCLVDGPVVNGVSTPSNSLCNGRILADSFCLDNASNDEVSTLHHTRYHLEQLETSDSQKSVKLTQYFNEGYCEVSELDDCCELTEAVTDVDSNGSHCKREMPEEDGDKGDILGGLFIFSEEG